MKSKNVVSGFALSMAALCCLFLTAHNARAAVIDTVISVESNQCTGPLNICFQTNANVLPLQNFTQPLPNHFFASVEIDAAAVHMFQDSRGGNFLYASFFDTYTLHGPLSLMGTTTTVTPDFHVTGTMAQGAFVPNCFLGFGGVRVEIGNWNPDATLEQFRVAPYGQQGSVGQLNQSLPGHCEATPSAIPVDLDVFGPITVTYGVPFDVAYQVVTSVAVAAVFDLTHTGVISFTIPDGSSLTSNRGFSQGVVPAAPEPSAFGLVGSLMLIGGAFRRRR